MTIIRAVEEKKTTSGKPYWRVQLQPGGWASTFSSSIGKICSEHVGTDLEVITSKNGDFTNIDSAKAPPAGSSNGSSPASPRDAIIVRQVAVKAAVELAVSSQTTDMGWILATAGALTEWMLGDQEPPEPQEIPF